MKLLYLVDIKISVMKIVGIILLIIGIVGIVIFGVQAINNSESYNIFGLDIAVSKANWTPLIVSVVITVVGVFTALMGRKR